VPHGGRQELRFVLAAVQDGDLVPGIVKVSDDVRPDEPRPADDQDTHCPRFYGPSGRGWLNTT
jgi:hypothetical protein